MSTSTVRCNSEEILFTVFTAFTAFTVLVLIMSTSRYLAFSHHEIQVSPVIYDTKRTAESQDTLSTHQRSDQRSGYTHLKPESVLDVHAKRPARRKPLMMECLRLVISVWTSTTQPAWRGFNTEALSLNTSFIEPSSSACTSAA